MSQKGIPEFWWIFEHAMYHARVNKGAVIAQEKYFDILRNKIEKTRISAPGLCYETALSTDCDEVTHYAIPSHIDSLIVRETGSRTSAWVYLMTKLYIPLAAWFECAVEEILSKQQIDGIMLWYPFPSIERIAKKYSIPLIYYDIAPLRYPVYKTLAYIDFTGANGSKNEAAKRYANFLTELAQDSSFEQYILTPPEILALLLEDDHIEKLKLANQEPVYEYGIALSPEHPYSHAFNNMYSQSEFIWDVKNNIDESKALIRSHPGDTFWVKKVMWSGDIDDSSHVEDFISKCKRIITTNSKTAFLAMLFQRFVHIIKSDHTTFTPGASLSFSEDADKYAENNFISFITFAYFVPIEYANNEEYLSYRLNKPTEKELYVRHLSYLLMQKGIELDKFVKLSHSERMTALLPPPPSLRFKTKVIGIEIVYGCNFKCRMCPVTAHSDSRHEYMDIELFKHIVKQINETPSIETIYLFNFGEPLLHPEFRQLLEILSTSEVAEKAHVIMFTNGSLLAGDKADALIDIPVVNELNISFDGMGDKLSYEILRGKHYDTVSDNAKKFAKHVKAGNINLKIQTCSIIPDDVSLDAAREELLKVFAPMGIDVSCRYMHDYNGDDKLEVSGKKNDIIRGSCSFVESNSLYIRVNGEVSPCCAVYDLSFTVGNVCNNTFENIINSDSMNKVRHSLRMGNRANIAHCENCSLSLAIFSDEYALVYWENKVKNGELSDPDEYMYIFSELNVETNTLSNL